MPKSRRGRRGLERCLEVEGGGHYEFALEGGMRDIRMSGYCNGKPFTARDVVRHPLVARIVRAYEARDGGNGE